MTKMNFNSHKSWHVNSKGNRDKLEKVEQKNDEKGSAAAERRREREKERDFEETQRMALKYNANSERALDFMYQPPPGLLKEEKKEEDEIPDIPENKEVRDFLKSAPTKGLWMPLGKEVKVMQCWRCKNYGHRTGDKECPATLMGSQTENERLMREDPMANYLHNQKQHQNEKDERKQQKLERLQELKDLLAKAEKRHMKKKLKRKMRKDEEKRKSRRKERKHRKRDSDSSSSDSDSSSSSSDSENDRKKR